MFTVWGVLRALPDGVLHALLASPTALWALKGILLLGCLLLVLGVRPFRAVAVPTALLLVLFDGLTKAFSGFVNHAQVGILFGAILLCLFPAADAFSILGRRRGNAARAEVYAGGVIAVAAFILAAYAFIGTHRIVRGGLALFREDAILIYLALRSLNYNPTGFQFGLLPLGYPLLAPLFKAGYALTTVFEVFSPACLLSRRFRACWLAVIVPFHFTTLLTMNIFFWENLFLIAVFIVPIGYVLSED
jgi:hypothetical protein